MLPLSVPLLWLLWLCLMRLMCRCCRFGWDSTQAKRIWAWGGDEGGAAGPTNVLVDCTTGAQHLPAIKATVVSAFRAVCSSGGVAGERLRGVRFDLTDALVHKDPAHRGPSQISPAASRVLKAALLAAGPCLVEPLFRITAQVPERFYGTILPEIAARRGLVDTVTSHEGTPLVSWWLVVGGRAALPSTLPAM